MSNAVFNRIRYARLKPSEKTMLLVLASIANDDGSTQKFASINSLMAYSCLSRRTVVYSLRTLEEQGIIKTVAKQGETPTYFINPSFAPSKNVGDDSHENPFDVAEFAPHATIAPLQILQENEQNLHGGGANIAQGDAKIDGKYAEFAPYTPTSITSLTPSTPAHDVRADEKAKIEKPVEKKPQTQKSAMPTNFGLSDAVKAWAAEHGHTNLEAHLDYFKGYVVANGKKYANWDQALMNAIRGDWAKLKGKTWQQPSQPAQPAVEPLTQPIKHKYATHDTVADPAALARLRSML